MDIHGEGSGKKFFQGSFVKLLSRILRVYGKEAFQISPYSFNRLKFPPLLENIDRAIARLKREIIRLNLISGGKTEELLRGDHSSSIEFCIQSQLWEKQFRDLNSNHTFGNEGHVWQPRYLILLKNVILDSQTGLLYSNKGRLIAESSAWPIHNLLLNSLPVPIFSKAKKIFSEGYTSIILPSNGFYHWLIEDLPVVLQLMQNQKKIRLVVFKQCPKYVEDFITQSGLPIVKVNRFVNLEEVTIINRNDDTGWAHPKDLLTLRETFKEFFSDNRELKIYVTRKGSSRFEDYEDDLIDFLKLDGWEIFQPEKYTLYQQINLFSSASVVVGVHGAGMAGMVWLREDARVMEILPSRRIQVFYRMAAELNLDYSQIYLDEFTGETVASSRDLALSIKREIDSRL